MLGEQPQRGLVSIRAPARGATDGTQREFPFTFVSIRAPARGATDRCQVDFGDPAVSIRAPARGATAIIGWQVLSGLSPRRAPACQKGTG